MKIDFTEISNKTDDFELFARDFLQATGLEIIVEPGRGADGGKDMILKEIRKGNISSGEIQWLVSCKHYAHSRKSVGVNDEINILERMEANSCKGFIGFYSTIASSSLIDRLIKLRDTKNFDFQLFDHQKIEKELWNLKSCQSLTTRYFPDSYANSQRKENIHEPKSAPDTGSQGSFDFEKRVNEVKTAMILLKIDEITTDYLYLEESDMVKVNGQLMRFEEHSNILIEERVFRFLERLSNIFRPGISEKLALSIFSMILTFFPRDHDSTNPQRNNELVKKGPEIGFNIAYDAFIKLGDLRVAMWALLILKFYNQEAKRRKWGHLLVQVQETYESLRESLKRPERNDLGPAQKLLEYFYRDLDKGGLSFPVLPSDLYKLTERKL